MNDNKRFSWNRADRKGPIRMLRSTENQRLRARTKKKGLLLRLWVIDLQFVWSLLTDRNHYKFFLQKTQAIINIYVFNFFLLKNIIFISFINHNNQKNYKQNDFCIYY